MTVLAPASLRQSLARKARDRQITSQSALIETQAIGMAQALQRLFAELAAELADERLSTIKTRKARDSALLRRAQRVISEQAIGMFGAGATRASANLGTLRPRIPLGQTDGGRALADRIAMLQQRLAESVNQQADKVLAQILEERGNKPRRQLAREYQEQLQGSMTFDRALTWARTEAAVATDTGAAAAYQAAGVEEIEWMAYKFPIWPRRHDKLDGKRVALGDWFEMPESSARLRWPHDPLGPVGEVVNCRCSHKPVRKRRSPTRTAPATRTDPQTRTPPPAPPVELQAPRGHRQRTLEQTRFDRERMRRAVDSLAAGNVSPEAQADLRDNLREILATHGLRSMRASLANEVAVRPLGRFTGTMSPSGLMTLDPNTARDASRYLQGEREWDATQRFKTLIHEEIHHAGPQSHEYETRETGGGRWRQAVIIEEVTTEMTARQILTEIEDDAPPDRKKQLLRFGSYPGYVRQVREAAEGVIAQSVPRAERDDVLTEVVAAAAQRFKGRHATGEVPREPRDALEAFTSDVIDSIRERGLETVPAAPSKLLAALNQMDPDTPNY